VNLTKGSYPQHVTALPKLVPKIAGVLFEEQRTITVFGSDEIRLDWPTSAFIARLFRETI
jgi:hypothetical protein